MPSISSPGRAGLFNCMRIDVANCPPLEREPTISALRAEVSSADVLPQALQDIAVAYARPAMSLHELAVELDACCARIGTLNEECAEVGRCAGNLSELLDSLPESNYPPRTFETLHRLNLSWLDSAVDIAQRAIRRLPADADAQGSTRALQLLDAISRTAPTAQARAEQRGEHALPVSLNGLAIELARYEQDDLHDVAGLNPVRQAIANVKHALDWRQRDGDSLENRQACTQAWNSLSERCSQVVVAAHLMSHVVPSQLLKYLQQMEVGAADAGRRVESRS